MSAPARGRPGDDQRQRAVDAMVARIVRASGGWNARARSRLAALAQARRIEPWRVLAAIRKLAAGVPSPARANDTSPPREAALPRQPAKPHARAGVLVGASLALGVALSAALVWVAINQAMRMPPEAPVSTSTAEADALGPEVGGTRQQGNTADARNDAPNGARTATVDRLTPGRQGAAGRTVPAAPAVFGRAPVLVGDLSTPAVRDALESLSASEGALERIAARAATPDAADQEALMRLSEAYLDCWPVLDRVRAAALVDALLRTAPHWNAAARDSLRHALEGARASREQTLRAWWRGAGAAGLVAALDNPNTQSPTGAFGAGAIEWLRPRAFALAEASAHADPGLAADLCDGWIAALDAAMALGDSEAATVQRDAALVAAIEALLRIGAPLERPGTPASAMGSLLDAVPWTSGASRRDRFVEAWKGWMADTSIATLALHGMTSVLCARRPGPWWDPWLVVDARATPEERAGAGDRLARALGGTHDSAAIPAPALRGVDPELLKRWRTAAAALAQKTEPARDADRIARAAEWMALVEVARLLERGRVSDADARLTQLEDPAGLATEDADRWRDGPPNAQTRTPPNDGTLEAELRKPRALEDRLNVLRALRTRPIHDLGPRDAETIAREALTSPSAQLRSVAQGVIVDVFAQGPQVLAAVLGEMHASTSASEAAQLAGSLAGVAPPRGSDAAMRAAAALLVTDQIAGLSPSDRHALDAASRELALGAAAAARALGGEAAAGARPEQAMHAWVAARAAEAKRIVPGDVLARTLNRRTAVQNAAIGGPQAFARDQGVLLELDAAILIERMPRRRTDIQGVLQRAAAARARAPDVFAQIIANARGLADLSAIALGVDRSEAGL